MPRYRYAFVDFLPGKVREPSGRIMLPIRIVNPHTGATWPTCCAIYYRRQEIELVW